MKKWTALLLALAMTLSLAACGSSGNQENASDMPASASGSAAEETPAPTDTETPAAAPAEDPAESGTSATGDPGSVLIAYFSWSGNTERVAQIIRGRQAGICLRSPRRPPTRTTTTNCWTSPSRNRRTAPGRSWQARWRTGTSTTRFLWATPTGGTMRPWRSIPSWSPMTGTERR